VPQFTRKVCRNCNIHPEDGGAMWQPAFEPPWKLVGLTVEFASPLKLLGNSLRSHEQELAGAPAGTIKPEFRRCCP